MTRSVFFSLLAVFLSVFLVVGLTASADAGRQTRDLVFEDEEEEQPAAAGEDTQAVVKVKATILLTRDGETTQVLPSHEFKSGDKVKLVYTTNIDAFVYWLSEGSTGDHYMLFPNPKVGMDNWVKKNEEYTIPVKGNFKFDDNVGKEKIILVLAPEKIPELEEAAKQAAVKGGKVPSDQVAAVEEDQETKRKSRDLVFEEEDDEDTGVATKAQASKDIKQPFFVAFELVHN